MILYLSERVNPDNIRGLQEALYTIDENKVGELPSDAFIKCLSQSQMKFMPNEVDRLIQTMVNDEKMSTINYKDFLKFSYLF